MRKTATLALIVFCFCPYLARADTKFPANCANPVPDISSWEITQTSRVEFRVSDNAVAYLGLSIEHNIYRNPDNIREFAKVVSRHIPFIPQRQELNEQSFFQTAATLYAKKDEQDAFSKLDGEIDPIFYMLWRTKENPRTGEDMLDGDVDIWFLRSSGECLTAQNEKVAVQFLTESVGNGNSRNIFVGVKYQIGKAYHILKVDRRDLILLMEGEK